MRVRPVSDPVYAPNSKGGPRADSERYPYVERWEADGEFMHAAYTRRPDDDDWSQAGTLVRDVTDEVQGDRLVSNVVGGRLVAAASGQEHWVGSREESHGKFRVGRWGAGTVRPGSDEKP